MYIIIYIKYINNYLEVQDVFHIVTLHSDWV